METVKINGTTFCAKCYAETNKQANGNEDLGFLIYEFLHYEMKECI